MDDSRIRNIFARVLKEGGKITVLTGAGISAESGIPTFRGPEGYWTVGSKVYQPQQMATRQMFDRHPESVWQWYLYRLGVCQAASPNPGHSALAEMEKLLGSRFALITQNVDNLHLRAGNSPKRTFQIHGNIFFVRCAAECRQAVQPIPAGITAKGKDEELTATEKELLACPLCGHWLRPHVLWFDETYNEHYYRAASALKVARETSLLLVVGTSGATNLPLQVAAQVHAASGIIIDINPEPNPFSHLAEQSVQGGFIQQPAASILPQIIDILKPMLQT